MVCQLTVLLSAVNVFILLSRSLGEMLFGPLQKISRTAGQLFSSYHPSVAPTHGSLLHHVARLRFPGSHLRSDPPSSPSVCVRVRISFLPHANLNNIFFLTDFARRSVCLRSVQRPLSLGSEGGAVFTGNMPRGHGGEDGAKKEGRLVLIGDELPLNSLHRGERLLPSI